MEENPYKAPEENSKPRHRWFRFILRAMLVLVALAAVEAALLRLILWQPFIDWLPGGFIVWYLTLLLFTCPPIALGFSALSWIAEAAFRPASLETEDFPATQD